MRSTLLPWLIWAVVIAGSIALPFYCAPVKADEASYVMRSDLGSNGKPMALRLFTRPCASAKVLAFVEPRWHAQLRASVLTWDGKDWPSCWLLQGGAVMSVDEEGVLLNAPHGLPVQAFRRDLPV